MQTQRRSPRSPTPNLARSLTSHSRSAGSSRTRSQLVTWGRRHLNVRTVVVFVVLSALLVPEAAVIIDAAV
jgi:hypothetical protein